MKAIIDLDWLDAEIEKMSRDVEKSKRMTSTYPAEVFFGAGFKMLRLVRSKCEPVEELEEGKVFGISDIRNKLSPIVNVIEMIENGLMEGTIDVHSLIFEEIKQVKKSIEYLTKS
jgi:hypothetical protein